MARGGYRPGAGRKPNADKPKRAETKVPPRPPMSPPSVPATVRAPMVVTEDLIRKLGRFVEFSVFGAETSVDWSIIGDRKELDVRGAHLSPYTYPVAIDLLERGFVTSKGIVTHRFGLADWRAAFDCAHAVDSIKVLLVPEAV